MLQHHWDRPELEAKLPVNSVVRYVGINKHLVGKSGVVLEHTNLGTVMAQFGHIITRVKPSELMAMPEAEPKSETPEATCMACLEKDARYGHTCPEPQDEPSSPQHVDDVKAPSHYMLFDHTESIEVIARAMTVQEFRGFCFGNVLKYRLRAGKKSELATMEKDLSKAAYYQELFDKHKDKCYGPA